ncbi:hypothetical protein ABBQ32_010616 [Trebouxia sp. C0010 RCD-2024]
MLLLLKTKMVARGVGWLQGEEALLMKTTAQRLLVKKKRLLHEMKKQRVQGYPSHRQLADL